MTGKEHRLTWITPCNFEAGTEITLSIQEIDENATQYMLEYPLDCMPVQRAAISTNDKHTEIRRMGGKRNGWKILGR